ncbi:hypothetical protein ACFL02_03800 [Planctomycetota bacterium]
MASGMCPCWADVVREELLEQLCPNELQEFKEALLASDIAEGEFQQEWRSQRYTPPGKEPVNEDEQSNYAPYRALQNLIEVFKVKTGGLELDVCYHDPENGDCYDEVSGLFFTVRGVFQYTPAGEKYKQFIETQGWVEFG